MSAEISIRRGSIYVPADVYELYFPEIEAIIAIIRDGVLQIMPVQHVSAGGCLLKIRNAHGDRVAAAQDVFVANDLGEWSCDNLKVEWDQSQAALVCAIPST
ncbi:hypothetical protein [Parasphingorhabdus sp.]|uniref:hypothetical protein n=1 Tax=Parasphingorhabdus sp. TaxID=2709688 RepID=UPI003BB069BD